MKRPPPPPKPEPYWITKPVRFPRTMLVGLLQLMKAAHCKTVSDYVRFLVKMELRQVRPPPPKAQ